MILTLFLIGVGMGIVVGALIISVSYLCTSIIRSRVSTEVPEAAYVKIEKMLAGKSTTTLPTYKAKAYDRNHNKIKDIEFEYNSSEYFYDGERISI